MKTKVLHLINSLEMGGAENQLLLLLSNFNKSKFEWHLGTLHKNSSLLKGFNKNEIFINDFSNKGRFSLFGLVRLYKYIKINNIEIIHTHLVHAGIFGFIIGKFAGCKYFFYTRHHTLSDKERSLLYTFLIHILKRYTNIICVSKSVYNHFLSKGLPKNKLKVIYNAVNPVFINVQERKKVQSNSLISVGRLVEAKDYKKLISAIKIIKKKINEVSCYIIGDGPEFSNLSKQIREEGLESSVFLLGEKSTEEIIPLLNEKEIYVCCSKYEGFNLALVEAMAMGKTSISTSVGIATEIIKDGYNGKLIENNTVNTLADSLSVVLKDDQFKRDSANHASVIIKELFAVEKITKSIEILYLEEVSAIH